MITLRTIFAIVGLVAMAACQSGNKPSTNNTTIRASAGMAIDTLFNDTINSSGEVIVLQQGDTAIVIDQLFCTLQLIHLHTGKMLGEPTFGLADSNFLDAKIQAACHIPEGGILLYGNMKVWWLTNNLAIKRIEAIRFPSTQDMAALELNPSSSNPAVYEPDFTLPGIEALNDTTLLLPIIAEHPFFNGFTTANFYTKGFGFIRHDIKSPQKNQLFGRRPGIYLQKQFIPSFYSGLLTQNGGRIFYSFEADSLIHLWSTSTKAQSFGMAGINMAIDYPTHQNLDFAENTVTQKQERKQYGRYLQLRSSKDGRLVARTYQCGTNAPDAAGRKYGLQVYQDGQLVADIPMQTQEQLVSITHPDKVICSTLIGNRLVIVSFKIPLT